MEDGAILRLWGQGAREEPAGRARGRIGENGLVWVVARIYVHSQRRKKVLLRESVSRREKVLPRGFIGVGTVQ